MNRIRIFTFLACMLLIFICDQILFAATYYISPNGSDITGIGNSASPWASLKKGMVSMVGGDTLICKNGIYTGINNRITKDQHPPFGTSGAWTIIKAETDGEAIFDGEMTRTMFGIDYYPKSAMFMQFEGILWKNANGVSITSGEYLKFVRCGNYDNGEGNTASFSCGNAKYILYENCYAYGSGRYKFLVYNSSYCIVRSCVARTDRVNAPAEPLGMYALYGAADSIVQNCIAIDSDQDTKYVYGGELVGAFANPVSSAADRKTSSKFVNCIALNCHLGGGSVDAGYTATYNNCVWWDITTMKTGNNVFPIVDSSASYSSCLFGNVHDYSLQGMSFYGALSGNIKNSIFYGFKGKGSWPISLRSNIGASLVNDYNCFFDNTVNIDGVNLGLNTKTSIDPLYRQSNSNGALKYIVRIEEGSNLAGKGENDSDIGANITTLIGTPGTLWGDTGYNIDTGVPLWPFPNEAQIRSKMRSYTYKDSNGTISGARGFCADGQSLTKYIWGYLGNPVPAELTRALEGHVKNSRGQGVTGVSMVISDGISDTADTDSSGAYAFAGLTLGSDYTITPVREGLTFSPPSRTIKNFSGTLTGLNFTASGMTVGDVVQPQELRVVGSAAQLGTVNPTKGDTAKIYFHGSTTGTYECRIFSINRVMVWQDKKEDTNMGIFEWFPRDMPSGGYMVHVQGPGFDLTKKFAVLR